MKCKYLYKREQSIPVIGGPVVHITENMCLLKMRDLQTKFKIYDSLLEKGLQGSVFEDDCPVANSNNWVECTFYEEE
jgi:hypothetical protein